MIHGLHMAILYPLEYGSKAVKVDLLIHFYKKVNNLYLKH